MISEISNIIAPEIRAQYENYIITKEISISHFDSQKELPTMQIT